MTALERANEVRIERSVLKRRIGRGEYKASFVLDDMPWYAVGMSVAELLKSQRGWGPTKTKEFIACSQAEVAPDRKLEDMTIRQRQLIADELREKDR